MSDPGTPTLDQLRVFATVVDTGSFAAAARHLHRSQPVISYNISSLERQLGIVLFERDKKRPTLTDAGRALLEDSRRVHLAVNGLRAKAKALTSGLEGELSVAVDMVFPVKRLIVALQAFATTFPTVALRLHVESLGAAAQLVVDRKCDFAASCWLTGHVDSLEFEECCSVELIPVASPEHSLSQYIGAIPRSALKEHVQLVLSDRTELTSGKEFGVYAIRTWRLADLSTKLALLESGLGWGNMPESLVEGAISGGKLKRLHLAEGDIAPVPLYIVRRLDAPLGPAARWLSAQLARG
jgi:DNA-binding transcriptional LysR family regulator